MADQHRQHPGVQRSDSRGADEAGRREQRPDGDEEFVSEVLWPRPNAWWWTCCSTSPGSGAAAPHPGPDLPARRDHGDRRPGRAVLGEEFEVLRQAPELAAERKGLDAWLAAPPDKTLALVAEMDDITPPGQSKYSRRTI